MDTANSSCCRTASAYADSLSASLTVSVLTGTELQLSSNTVVKPTEADYLCVCVCWCLVRAAFGWELHRHGMVSQHPLQQLLGCVHTSSNA